jgi:threonine dehydratase
MALALDDIRTAETLLRGQVVPTPTVASRRLSEVSGANITLKFENLQYTGSFKDRGAYVKLVRLSAEEKRNGVVAASAGNHAQGVAYHAQRLGIPATIVMPHGTPFTKVRAVRRFGAKAVFHGGGLSEAADQAHVPEIQNRLAFVHPYDDEDIIAGQGTVALEMLAAAPQLEVLVVPIGGGGLISGCAIAAKAIRPEIEIVGVESELYPSMDQCLRRIEPRLGGQTIADGIAVKTPGHITRTIIGQLVDEILLVDERTLEEGVQMLLEIEKTVAEGAGAAAFAAVLAHRPRFAGRETGIVISGGNIDSRPLANILMRGLVREGRLVKIRVEIPDQPGELARVTRILGQLEGNIVEVIHQRMFYDVPAKLTELDLVIETRDSGHAMRILDSLEAKGYPTRMMSDTESGGG